MTRARGARWLVLVAETHALHAIAYLALHASSPLEAKRLVDRVGRRLTPLEDADEGARLMRWLGPAGTCLSRSIAVAARLTGARVAIGVTPLGKSAVHAHAWVEYAGQPLHPTDAVGEVIVRI